MATLRKRGKVWHARWYVPEIGADGTIGVRREERSTGQRDRALAREVAKRFERESLTLAEGPAPLPLDRAIAGYLAHIQAIGRAGDTLAFYAKKARHLLRVLGADTDVHRLGAQHATLYIHQRRTELVRKPRDGEDVGAVRKVALASIAKELGLLRSVLRWQAREGAFEGSADWCSPPELRGSYKPRDRALTVLEYRRLDERLSENRRDYLAIFVGTGVRDSELYRIEARDLVNGRLHVRGTKSSRADRWLPLRDELVDILRRRAKSKPRSALFPRWGNVRRDLHAACGRAGIPPVSPNDLRRTFATWHAERGTPELVVVAMMGHSSSAMVRRVYARVGNQAQLDAAARFPALRGTAPPVPQTPQQPGDSVDPVDGATE